MSGPADAPWSPPDDRPDYTVLLVFTSPRLARFVLARHRTRGWELPGGRVEPGESLMGAARREWHEETGLPLVHLEPLLLHARPDGARGHLFLGALRLDEEGGLGTAARGTDPAEKIEEVRAVPRLDAVAPLAFPDDPYAAVAAAVWERAGSAPWTRPAEGRSAFVARLSTHPEAHPVRHAVVPHPSRSV